MAGWRGRRYLLLLLPALISLALLSGLTTRQGALPPTPVGSAWRRPPPRGPPELYSSGLSLLDLRSVSLVANPRVCPSEPLLLLVLVASHPSHAYLRTAHRAHAPWEALEALGVRRVFVLADGSRSKQAEYPAVSRAAVLEESAAERDLVVADFVEHYRNLTYKHALALTWAHRYCPSATHILKMDDDILVDVWGVARLLAAGPALDPTGRVVAGGMGRQLRPGDLWAAGLVQRGLAPQRRRGKWRVTEQEFPGSLYPPFLAGWAYVASRPAAAAILGAAATLPPFWIDDVHMTGTAAAAAGVPRYSLSRYYSLLPGPATCCLGGAAPGPPQYPGRLQHSALAPLCGLLVAPSEKNSTLVAAWLRAARGCHQHGHCSFPSPAACPRDRLYRGVGTVIAVT